MASTGHVAGHPLERHGALLDPYAGRGRYGECLRTLTLSDALNLPDRLPNRTTNVAGRQIAACTNLSRGQLDGAAIPIEPAAP